MIFLGPLYEPCEEEKILANSNDGIANQVNHFQIRLLNGFSLNHLEVQIVNVLPVGIWMQSYKKLLLKSRQWEWHGNTCYEIGSINLPIIKQLQREIAIKKLLKKMTKTESEIVIYSTYLPFLRAVYKLPKRVKTTLIVTDLPEYYDFGKTSLLKKMLRKLNNRRIYSCLSRIDRFVLLTDAMKEPLAVKDRPYVVVEGIGYAETEDVIPVVEKKKEIIFYAGSLHFKFGIQNLLDAFALYEDRNVELWICGAGEAQETIENLRRKNDRLHYFGYVSSERIKELRAQATVLINPRSNEGEYTKYSFPSKTMEYMASGIPVVMYKLSGVPDEYDQYLTYIRGNTATDIKEALDRLFAMPPEERDKLGLTAQAFIAEQKSERVQAEKILALVLNDSRRKNDA